MPRNTTYLRAIWNLAPSWQLTGQVTRYASFDRQTGDPRAPLAGSTTADLTLKKHWAKNIDITLSGRNLFDADVREASNGPAPPQTNARIPNDLPQPRRTVMLDASVHW